MTDILRRFKDLPHKTYAVGEMLLEEGRSSGRLFVLKSGTVTVIRDGVVIASIAEPGAVFGEMSALLDRPHSASVVAATPVEAWGFGDGLNYLEHHPALAVHVAVLLARRLENTTGLVTRLKTGAVEKRSDTGLFERLIGFLTGHPSGAKTGSGQPRPR